jgi:hypothetical protein
MTYWFTGEEEHSDARFTTASLGLYTRAGSWCMSQVRYRPESEIPPEWLVPDWLVKGWGATRQANDLVAHEVWEPVTGGYRYAWIRYQNTANEIRRQRKRERDKKARRGSDSPGESTAIPRGIDRDSPGDIYGGISPRHAKHASSKKCPRGGTDQHVSENFPRGRTGGTYGYVT